MKKILHLLLSLIFVLFSSCENMFGALKGADDEDSSNSSVKVNSPFYNLEFSDIMASGNNLTGSVCFSFYVSNEYGKATFYFGEASAFTENYKTHNDKYIGFKDLSYATIRYYFDNVDTNNNYFRKIKVSINSYDGAGEQTVKFTNVPIYWN